MKVVLNTYLKLRDWEEIGEARLFIASEEFASSDYSFYFPRGQIELEIASPLPLTRAELLEMELRVLNKQLEVVKADSYIAIKTVEDKIANLLALPEIASEESSDE